MDFSKYVYSISYEPCMHEHVAKRGRGDKSSHGKILQGVKNFRLILGDEISFHVIAMNELFDTHKLA